MHFVTAVVMNFRYFRLFLITFLAKHGRFSEKGQIPVILHNIKRTTIHIT
jgi:hypothetical protein